MRLVVAAFWIEDDSDTAPLESERIKGSGSVVTFTPEQVRDQPGIFRVLERFTLIEAETWSDQHLTDQGN